MKTFGSSNSQQSSTQTGDDNLEVANTFKKLRIKINNSLIDNKIVKRLPKFHLYIMLGNPECG